MLFAQLIKLSEQVNYLSEQYIKLSERDIKLSERLNYLVQTSYVVRTRYNVVGTT